MAEKTRLSANMEDYIEVIYQLILERNVARSKEISNRLKVKRPSVTSALKVLAQEGLIHYKPYGLITLTPAGNRVARSVVEKHQIIARFLIDILDVEPDKANEAACKMEHEITKDILKRLAVFLTYTQELPDWGKEIIEDYKTYYRNEGRKLDCDHCITAYLKAMKRSNNHAAS